MKYHLGALLLLFCGHLCSGWFKFQGDLRLINPRTLQRYLRFGNSLSHWGYEHGANESPPDQWDKKFPACKGAQQSPIAINTAKTIRSSRLEPLLFHAYSSFPEANLWTVVNNGHTVQFGGSYNSSYLPTLSKGGLAADYAFTQLHFHWGTTSLRGSEHVINDKRFPLELHIVHRHSSGDNREAHGNSTGLAVVGILFELTSDERKRLRQLDTIAEALTEVIEQNKPANVTLEHFTLSGLLPPSTGYYRYMGSLTTPPCTEAVQWFVMKKPQKITEKQLSAFRRLDDGNGLSGLDKLGDNFRPLQAPYQRRIENYRGKELRFSQ
ncbi:hypothetical protein RvY_03263 [Ramazzottius varieornatus]|uniref:Carbonic anhydrase n=1 Tax=Ramazzottius varieornatus TaxID=947166 RepID=A0A1D1UN98_RAMVA|nr:hypothetical protein RvY_03263 [Ramazzottius varieornatus]